jgi:hypothetical protein
MIPICLACSFCLVPTAVVIAWCSSLPKVCWAVPACWFRAAIDVCRLDSCACLLARPLCLV